MSGKIISCKYEVFGRVQGVFFRKYTREKALSLDIRGYVRNTNRDTVEGEIQGEAAKLNEMKRWLSTKGSPQSRIDKVDWSDEKSITSYSYDSFSVKH